MKKTLLWPIFIVIGLSLACESEKKVNSEAVNELKKSSEIKRIKEADIINQAMKWGDEISKEAQESLMGTLQNAIAEKGVAGAVEFCNQEALPITQEIADKYGISIRRVSFLNRNPANEPNKQEKNLLEAYHYNVENKIESQPNIQKIDDGSTLLYTKAIAIPGGLCLNCHGEPGKDIDGATLEKINELYPKDKATGYGIGDLRGMWSLAIPQKEIVNSM